MTRCIDAHYQHEGLEFKHPHGGQAKYLEAPLFEHAEDYVRRLAKNAVTDDGSDLHQAMIDNVEDLAHEVQKLAPVEWGDLRNSAHPVVHDRVTVVYDRPPHMRRLTEHELDLKHRWGVPR